MVKEIAKRAAYGVCVAFLVVSMSSVVSVAAGNVSNDSFSRAKKMLAKIYADNPVTQWECTRAKRIEKMQGNENKRVKHPCQAAGLW